MTSQQKCRLGELDRVLHVRKVRVQISPIITRVQAELARKSEALMTWEPIPLELFGGALSAEIRSGWIFVLRAGADTGPERHPNSHQRMMSFQGKGDIRIKHDGRWHSNFLISEPAPIERRWISIPPNVWHRPVVGKEANWVVVSFHTVLAEELIEERPSPTGSSETKRMRYLDQ